MKKVVLLFCLLVCSTLAFSQIIFLNPGKSIPTDSPNGLLVYSYSFGTGETNPEITLTLDAGSAAPSLLNAATNGTVFKKMELVTYELGKVSSKITISDVMIVSYVVSASSTTITLSFSNTRTK